MRKFIKSHVLWQLNCINKHEKNNILYKKNILNISTPTYSLMYLSLILGMPIQFVHAQVVTSEDFKFCQPHLVKGQPPTFRNITKADAQLDNNYALCFAGFSVLYSTNNKNPRWSAEYLTDKRLYEANGKERIDNFHEERNVIRNDRATLKDYKGSGYDRGHLAPNGDMATNEQQYDSFSLANIVPQSPYFNRTVWREVEATTRYYAKKYKHAYVVTGAIYDNEHSNNRIAKMNGSVSIPSHIYKAIYLPNLSQAGVYFAPNDESGRIELLSLTNFDKRTGIKVFPALIQQVNNHQIYLLSEELTFDATENLNKNKKAINLTNQQKNNPLENDENNDYSNNVVSWYRQLITAILTWIKIQLQQ